MSEASWCPPPPPVSPQQDRRQLIGGQDLDSLCHLGWQPIIMTGLLRNIAVAHFSQAKFIETPELRQYIWQKDEKTRILIESVYRYRAAIADLRPAILIKRNSFQNFRTTSGDKAGQDKQGNPQYSTMWVGSHTLFCIHTTGAACEILSTEIQREFTRFGPVIVDTLGLYRFQVTEVGSPAIVEEATEVFAVPVTVAWCYGENWMISREQLPLTSVIMNLRIKDCW